MCFDTILRNISKHIALTPEEKQAFTSSLIEKKLEKGQVLLHQDSFCDAIYFVNEGILRAYFLTPEGKETTIMFAIKDWWVTDMYAFINVDKSALTIEALEPTTVLTLTRTNFDRFLTQIPKFERFFRILLQNAYIREQQRGLENLSLTARDKYLLFIKKYPAIAERVNQKQIASYLGITPEFLSMVKNEK